MKPPQAVQKPSSESPDGSAGIVASDRSKDPQKQKTLHALKDSPAQKIEKPVPTSTDNNVDSIASGFIGMPQEQQALPRLVDAEARNLTDQELEQDMQKVLPRVQGVDKPMDLSDATFDSVSNLLRQAGREEWSLRPRTFVVLWIINAPELIEEFIRAEAWDIALPYAFNSLPKGFSASQRRQFLEKQEAVLTKAAKIEEGSESAHASFGML